MSLIIQNWARWDGPPPQHADLFNWIPHWFVSDYGRATAFLIVTSFLILTVSRWYSRKFRKPNLIPSYALWMGMTGILFVFFMAPHIRFILGYIALLIGVGIASFYEIIEKVIYDRKIFRWAKPGVYLIPVLLLIFLVGKTPLVKMAEPNRALYGSFFFIPKNSMRMKESQFEKKRYKTFTYFSPVYSNHCRDAPLPCSPGKLYNIEFRDPAKGLKGGFVKEEINLGEIDH